MDTSKQRQQVSSLSSISEIDWNFKQNFLLYTFFFKHTHTQLLLLSSKCTQTVNSLSLSLSVQTLTFCCFATNTHTHRQSWCWCLWLVCLLAELRQSFDRARIMHKTLRARERKTLHLRTSEKEQSGARSLFCLLRVLFALFSANKLCSFSLCVA